ncbi:MAG: hypothetical protein LBJ35_01130 [Spirochaetaceae bacterium]|jgi:hypothetical protein|nr:hypothetical protein [Spirochaetaceae bacterium]
MVKKLKYAGFAAAMIIAIAFVTGCATTSGSGRSPVVEKEYGLSGSGKAATIEDAYPDRFEKTKIGMDFEEFKQVWPEAKKIGESQDEVIYEFTYGNTYIYTLNYVIHEKFYFADNKLTRYEGIRSLQ